MCSKLNISMFNHAETKNSLHMRKHRVRWMRYRYSKLKVTRHHFPLLRMQFSNFSISFFTFMLIHLTFHRQDFFRCSSKNESFHFFLLKFFEHARSLVHHQRLELCWPTFDGRATRCIEKLATTGECARITCLHVISAPR